jgi:hypothetical protein
MLSSYYRKLNFVLLKGTRFRVPLFLLFCLMTVTSAQNFTRLGLPNYSVFSSVVTQTEVVAVVHPNDPNSIFASANAISFSPQFFVSEGIYVSSDGGTSFWGTDTCSGGPSIAFHGGDPGITIDKNGTFILTRNGKIPLYGLYSHRSTDQGRTWSNAKAITNIELERAWLAADNSPSSPYYGRVYAAWVRYSPPYPLVFVYTDDGGENWSSIQQVNSPTDRNYGGGLVVDKQGVVYAVWAAVTSSSPFTEKYTGFAKSTNGGTSWSVTENVFVTNGIQGILPTKQNIRVNSNPQLAIDLSGGATNGWLYVVTTQKNTSVAGADPDIIFNRSTDGGNTWSAGVRVNQDQLNNGKIQFFPAMTVDEYGGINVIFYDDRATTSDSAGVFLARSLDNGDTWTEYEISDKNFEPTPIGGLGQGYQGDNISIVYSNNTLHPFWMDNRTGIYQIQSVKIPLSLVGIEDNTTEVPTNFRMGNASPNPFNPQTTFTLDLPNSGNLQISLFDSRGSLVETVFNGMKEAATHRFIIERAGLSSGVYFVQAIFGNQQLVQKILLLK